MRLFVLIIICVLASFHRAACYHQHFFILFMVSMTNLTFIRHHAVIYLHLNYYYHNSYYLCLLTMWACLLSLPRKLTQSLTSWSREGKVEITPHALLSALRYAQSGKATVYLMRKVHTANFAIAFCIVTLMLMNNFTMFTSKSYCYKVTKHNNYMEKQILNYNYICIDYCTCYFYDGDLH